MTLCFYYHADRTGGSSAYHWIAKNYYNPNNFLITGIYSGAQRLLDEKIKNYPQLKGKTKLSGYVTKSIKVKPSNFDNFLIRAGRNEIDVLLHYHNQNIIDYSVLRKGLGENVNPTVMFSIRKPILQLKSIFNARQYFELPFDKFLKKTKSCHFWNTMTYQLISCLLTVSSIKGNREITRKKLGGFAEKIKSQNYRLAIASLLDIAYENNIVFIETFPKETITPLAQIEMMEMLETRFCNSCKIEYFNQPKLSYNQQTNESRKKLNESLERQLEFADESINLLDNLLYSLSDRTSFYC